MRTLIALATTLSFSIGCSDSAPPSPVGDADVPGPNANSRDGSASHEALRIIDRAFVALGGSYARERLRRGYIRLHVNGTILANVPEFANSDVTFEAYFDLPRFERRDVYTNPESEHLIMISNSGDFWVGDQTGKGRRLPAPPQEAYRGPFLVAVLGNIVEMRENSSSWIVRESQADAAVIVVDQYVDDRLGSSVSFDRETGLPTQLEKLMFDIQGDSPDPAVHTVTTFSDYKKFGAVTLPTVVSVQQSGSHVFTARLLSADFDSPVAASHFVIPE